MTLLKQGSLSVGTDNIQRDKQTLEYILYYATCIIDIFLPRIPLQIRELGNYQSYEVYPEQMPDSATGKGHPWMHIHTGVREAGEQSRRKGSGILVHGKNGRCHLKFSLDKYLFIEGADSFPSLRVHK